MTTATYTYDSDGYRTKKEVGGTTTIYAWRQASLMFRRGLSVRRASQMFGYASI